MTTPEQRENHPDLPGGTDDQAPGDFDYACPRCGLRQEQFSGTCPECGAGLGELFSATYRIRTPTGARIIALAVLIVLAVLVLVALVVLLVQGLGDGLGSPGPKPAL